MRSHFSKVGQCQEANMMQPETASAQNEWGGQNQEKRVIRFFLELIKMKKKHHTIFV